MTKNLTFQLTLTTLLIFLACSEEKKSEDSSSPEDKISQDSNTQEKTFKATVAS